MKSKEAYTARGLFYVIFSMGGGCATVTVVMHFCFKRKIETIYHSLNYWLESNITMGGCQVVVSPTIPRVVLLISIHIGVTFIKR